MSFIRILVMCVLAPFLFMPIPAQAELHSDTVLANGATYVDIDRYITRGGVLLPIFYTSKQDLYLYPLYTICTLKEVDYKTAVKNRAEELELDVTIYDDLRVVIYESEYPFDTKQIYREVKDLNVHDYCEIAGVTNDERMGWPLVVQIPGEESPIGNDLYWWTEW